MLYALKFTGPFGFMKPWTAVRDGKTNSLQFLTFSTLEGIRQKLGVTAIPRCKLSWGGVGWQQEVTQPRGWVVEARQQRMSRPRAVLERGVLLSPVLVLGLVSAEDAHKAQGQHVCLSRNEDVLLPTGPAVVLTSAEFDALPGFELLPADPDEAGAMLVGHDRYQANTPMYGVLSITVPPPVAEDLLLSI